MIGPILLALSWILLRLEGKGLDVLGFNKPGLPSLVLSLLLPLALVAVVCWYLVRAYRMAGVATPDREPVAAQ
jgi:hypothetical protein